MGFCGCSSMGLFLYMKFFLPKHVNSFTFKCHSLTMDINICYSCALRRKSMGLRPGVALLCFWTVPHLLCPLSHVPHTEMMAYVLTGCQKSNHYRTDAFLKRTFIQWLVWKKGGLLSSQRFQSNQQRMGKVQVNQTVNGSWRQGTSNLNN